MRENSQPNHIKILIIDDDRILQQTLGMVLNQPDVYRVAHAYDGDEGVHIAHTLQPDLILLDMNMPKMNGLEVLQQLSTFEEPSPVIFMTAVGSERIAMQAFRLGVRDYLVKPFRLQELEQAINKVLRTIKLEREKEALTRQLHVAEGVQNTMVALSHHINNQLQVAFNATNLVEEALLEEDYHINREQLLAMIHLGQTSLTHITDILRVLERITAVNVTPYDAETMMLDLDKALKQPPENC